MKVFLIMVMMMMEAMVQGNLIDKIRTDSDLSQFYNKMLRDPYVNLTVHSDMPATIFAPGNMAFQLKPIDDVDVKYHMANVAVHVSKLHNQLPSLATGNPPLWITRIKNPNHEDRVYVNNALIAPGKSISEKKQVLHVLEDVLVGVTTRSPTDDAELFNPSALTLLARNKDLNLGEHRLDSYYERVRNTDRKNIFENSGPFTFFIPVDEAFKHNSRPDKVDLKVIDGHIVPQRVLFTAPTPKGHEYPTLANGDMLRVTVSFSVQGDGPHRKVYVESHTVVGDATHTVGRVMAEVVVANIPVRNGVVHLISAPLMIVDNTVMQFLQEDPQGPLSKTYSMIREAQGNLMSRMNGLQELTLFAPSNEAWEQPYLHSVINDREHLQNILDLHLVERNLSADFMMQQESVPTSDGRNKLWFRVIESREGRKVTVEAGGVNATLLTADISATNGKIHIIDRVLGVPYMTVKQKLASDPAVSITNRLGERSGVNGQLQNPDRSYTYFVPIDAAWNRAEIQRPTELHKVLHLTTTNDYHVRQLLERHLVIADRPFTLADLRQLSRRHGNQTFTLPSVRDTLSIKFMEAERAGPDNKQLTKNFKDYFMEWRGDKVQIVRADVNCTNGIIHVIDRVLMMDSDVTVGGTASHTHCSYSTGLLLTLIVALYKLY